MTSFPRLHRPAADPVYCVDCRHFLPGETPALHRCGNAAYAMKRVVDPVTGGSMFVDHNGVRFAAAEPLCEWINKDGQCEGFAAREIV